MRRTFLLPVLLLSLLALGGRWLADLRNAEDLLIQRRYGEAAQALAAVLPDLEGRAAERAGFLLGEAQHLAGQFDAAVQTWEGLLASAPDGEWRHRARFRIARSHAAAGRRAEAATLYREEIARLIGLERKEQVAKTYLTLAQASLDGGRPDPLRAIGFFDQALDLGLPEERARAVGLAAAQASLRAADLRQIRPRDAVSRFQELEAEDLPAAYQAQVLLGLGAAQRRYGDGAAARRALRDVLALDPGEELAGDAAWEVALSYGVPTPVPALVDRAVDALRTLRRDHPSHREAASVGFSIARCMLHVGRTQEGLDALRGFLAEAGDSNLPEIAEARALVGDVLAMQEDFTGAIAAWREYLAAHPAHGQWERVQQAIVDAEWQLAISAFQKGVDSHSEARERLDAFTRQHPLDPRNPEAALTLGRMLAKEEDYAAARGAYQRCVQRFPGKPASSQAQYRIGEIHERHLFDYTAALVAYRKVTWGPFQAAARTRIAALEQEVLRIRSEKPWRTDQQAGFTLTTRNIRKVRVRVFRLDLESYFRATYTAEGVERLDIEVIEPDHVFETSPDAYVAHRETERFVSIPTDGPGAYVVKVDDQQQEATGMVLVTDIALIAKSSRQEFLVFAQDVRRGVPVADAEVILSEGTKVLAEGQTGSDGIWRFRGGALQQHDALRVFAVAANGSGAGNLQLSGLGYSPGLSAKGFLFTDRPAYEPGEQVELKGIAREVRDGRYIQPTGSGYRATIVAPNGLVLMDQSVKFTAFGTFACTLPLAADAPLGTWRARLTRPGGGESFERAFQVARYEVPTLSVEIETEQRVVFRGDSIEGHVQVRFFDGQPARGKQVALTFTLPDGSREVVGNADEGGRFPFSFPTTAFGEEAVASLVARVPGEPAVGSLVVPVVVTALTAQVDTLRDVYLAGEPFSPEVSIQDRAGKPAGDVEGVLTVVRLVRGDDGVVSEVPVAEETFRTQADGKASVAGIQVEEGGRIRLRVAVEDRFGNRITGTRELSISGDKDRVKLRLLTDGERFRVGDTVRFTVVNRGEATLALRSDQGDGILRALPLQIPRGRSTLEVELGPEHAPNCAIALAMVDGTALHLAERELQVARDLQIQLELAATARPGGTVPVTVRTLDPAGQPVAAEVALSLVDQALLQIHPDGTPSITRHFWGGQREVRFRTVSSCSWAYRGRTRRMSQELASESYRGVGDTGLPAEGGPGAPSPMMSPDGEVPARGRPERYRARTVMPRGGGGVPAFGGQQAQAVTGLGIAPSQEEMLLDDAARASGFIELEKAQNMAEFEAHLHSIRDRVAPSFGEFPTRLPFNLGSGGFEDSVVGSGDMGIRLLVPPDQPRIAFSTTGAWLSSVRTDEAGQAVVELKLPDNITRWQLTGRGVTKATDVGDARAQLITTKELVADLAMPLSPLAGDRIFVRVSGRDTTGVVRDLAVSSEITRDGSTLDVASIEGAPGPDGTTGQATSIRLTDPGTYEVLAKVAAGEDRDEIVRSLLVREFGAELADGAAGSTGESAAETLDLAAGPSVRSQRLTIRVGPDPAKDLVRIALGRGYQTWNCRVGLPTVLATAARGDAALQVLRGLGGNARLSQADRLQLRAVAERAVSRLLRLQQQDGGWSWIGSRSADPRTTAAVIRLLRAASQEGIRGVRPALSRAADHLLRQLRGVQGDEAADLLWALAVADRAAFEQLNRVHRERERLRPDGVARLALAWLALDRRGLAAELKGRLAAIVEGQLPRAMGRELETAALALRALAQLDPRGALVQGGLKGLKRRQLGAGWGTPEATSAALSALLVADGDASTPSVPRRVLVKVNGKSVATLDAAAIQSGAPIQLAGDPLQQGANRIEIAVQGGGVAHYQLLLTGIAPGFAAVNRRAKDFWFARTYLAANRKDGDEELRPGFSTVTGRGVKRFSNPVKGLAVGDHIRVTSSFTVRREALRKSIGPIIIEEPIPAGCAVRPGSLRGSHAHAEVGPTSILLYYPRGTTHDGFRYELEALHQGEYRALPTKLVGALRPDLVAYGKASSLTVRGRGEPGGDAYRWTPDELFRLAQLRFGEGDLLGAGEHLDVLLKEWSEPDARLNDRTYREVAKMMLLVSIERDDSASVVQFFEELKNRFPDYVVSFDRILRVGDAYREIGEHEAALLVFEAAAEASFLKDAAVAKVLESQGEQIQSVRFLERLLNEYPDLNTMRMSHYGLAQQLAARAAKLPPGPASDPRVGSQSELRGMSLAALRECQVLFPEDPLAEEIVFAEATTLLEGKDLEAALAVAQRALRSHPSSTFVDEYLYTLGYAQFALGQHDQAFEVLKRVAQETFATPKGGQGPSESRQHAIYLQGQIHHARGEPDAALKAYKQVEERFSDAAEAKDYFLHRRLGMEEVTTVEPGKTARFQLLHRNLSKVELQVFKVDLMRLYLLQKSLDDIRGVQLQGIAPTVQREIDLGDGRDYRDRETGVDLDLKGSGAWLVVARSGSDVATGLILRTGLKLDIQEDTPIGRLRVNVKRGDGVVANVDVRVVASGDRRIRSGKADLRGVFVADNLVGEATVIVRVGGEYAFYRGTRVHQPGSFRPPTPKAVLKQPKQSDRKKGGRFDALEQNFLFNGANRARQQRWLEENVIQNVQRGVEVQRTR